MQKTIAYSLNIYLRGQVCGYKPRCYKKGVDLTIRERASTRESGQRDKDAWQQEHKPYLDKRPQKPKSNKAY